jgi:transcriptional regulator with XRE-family HTH domain
MSTIGETIKRTRKGRGITQDDIAKLFGIDRSTVAMWELGRNIPDINTVCALAKYFEVSTDYLLGYPAGNPNDLAIRISKLDPGERETIEAIVSVLENRKVQYESTCLREIFK